MTDLVKYGHVVRGYLGVEAQNLTPELAKEFKLHSVTGVLVGGVFAEGTCRESRARRSEMSFRGSTARRCVTRVS